MRTLKRRLRADDSGQDLVEYAMLMAFISLVCIVALQSLGTAINTTYGSVSTSLVSSLAAGS